MANEWLVFGYPSLFGRGRALYCFTGLAPVGTYGEALVPARVAPPVGIPGRSLGRPLHVRAVEACAIPYGHLMTPRTTRGTVTRAAAGAPEPWSWFRDWRYDPLWPAVELGLTVHPGDPHVYLYEQITYPDGVGAIRYEVRADHLT